MEQTRILVFGKNEEILEVLLRVINRNEWWAALGSSEEAEILRLFYQHPFDLVLLGAGITEDEENRLRNLFVVHRPGIKVIQHLGGGGGLLETEIRSALQNHPDGNFSVPE